MNDEVMPKYDELLLANAIQQGSMPHVFPAFPGRRDIDVFARMVPSDVVGGDMFDYFFIDDTHFFFAVADVSRTGVPAALFISSVRSSLYNFAKSSNKIEDIISQTNDFLANNNVARMELSMFVGILDTSSGWMKCVDAGHTLPYVSHREGSVTLLAAHKNPRMGVNPGLIYSASDFQLFPGDRIVLCSDFVKGEEKRVGSYVEEHYSEDNRSIVENIISSFSDEKDRTVMCVDFVDYRNIVIDTVVDSVKDVDRYGGVNFPVDIDTFNERGFEYADIVKVIWNGKSAVMPLVPDYRYLAQGSIGLLSWPQRGRKSELISFGGNFALENGFLDEDAEYPVHITIRLYKKGGFINEFERKDLVRSNNRNDYPLLSDEEYANFREVNTTGTGRGKLYRGSSPISRYIARSKYADAALKIHGILSCYNLVDRMDELSDQPDFAGSYYSGTDIHCYHLDTNMLEGATRDRICNFYRDLLSAKLPCYVHCIEGQDRTGFVIAVLECLMGASYKEVIDDYMTTFYNYYGVERGTLSFNIVMQNIINTLEKAFNVTRLSACDMMAGARRFLITIGLSENEIERLREMLG